LDQQTILWILGGLCAINTLLLTWIKLDIKSLWKRADCHGHIVECDNDKCKTTTGGVVITGAGGRR
jgi:hypothetical protein